MAPALALEMRERDRLASFEELTMALNKTTARMKVGAVSGVLAIFLSPHSANAIDTMESIGAEKCGGQVKSYEIEFLSPENATLEATAKVMVKGAAVLAPNAVTLSVDSKPCTNARCGFQAKKGETYRFAAMSRLPRLDDLCIVVARP